MVRSFPTALGSGARQAWVIEVGRGAAARARRGAAGGGRPSLSRGSPRGEDWLEDWQTGVLACWPKGI